MWFAALSGNYQQSPWVVSLIDKLLDNVPSVVELMDENDLSQVSAKWLQTATSTTKLTHSIRLARLVRSCFIKNAPCFARRSFMNATSDPPQKAF